MLNELQERFALESLVLNRPKRCIEAKGSDRNVNIFKEAFGLLVEKLESSVNQELNKDLSLLTKTLNKPNSAIIECEICLMEIDQPYRLQVHIFLFNYQKYSRFFIIYKKTGLQSQILCFMHEFILNGMLKRLSIDSFTLSEMHLRNHCLGSSWITR